MFNDQQLVLANIRYLAKAGGDAEFYRLLRDRILSASQAWEQLPLTDGERAVLVAGARRLLAEISLFEAQGIAAM